MFNLMAEQMASLQLLSGTPLSCPLLCETKNTLLKPFAEKHLPLHFPFHFARGKQEAGTGWKNGGSTRHHSTWCWNAKKKKKKNSGLT
jgi:hypothetical protein